MLDHVQSAPALKELNLLSRGDATRAAIAYLKGEYEELAELLDELESFALKHHTQIAFGIANEDAYSAAETLSESAAKFFQHVEEQFLGASE